MRRLPPQVRRPALRAGLLSLVAAALSLFAPVVTASRIEALIADAEDLGYLEAFVPARGMLEAGLRAAERLGNARLTALCLDRIGLMFDFEGEVGAGAARHHRALDLARAHHDRAVEAAILASVGLARWRQSDYTAAMGALREARAIHEDIGDTIGLARTLVFVGRVHFKQGEYDAAQHILERAVELLAAGTEYRWSSIAFEGLGDVAVERGFFVQALTYFDRALHARRAIGDGPGESYMLHIIGRAYLLQGGHRQALVRFRQALAIAEQSRSVPARALALYHIGIAQSALGNNVEALRSFDEALALKEQLGDRRQQAWIVARSGDALVGAQDSTSASERYRRAIQIWESIGDLRGLSTGLSRGAEVAFDLEHFDEAAELLRRNSNVVSDSQPPFLAIALANLGKALAAGGHGAEALAVAQRAEAATTNASDDVRWQAFRSLAWVKRRLGRADEALQHYRDSLAAIERLRSRVVSSAPVRAGFLEGKQVVYADTVALLMTSGRAEEALDIAERSRARAFLDLLSGRRFPEKALDDNGAVERTARAAFIPMVRPRDTGRAPLANADAYRGERLRDQDAASAATYPDLTRLGTAPSLTVEQMKAEARRTDATLLAYFSANDQLFIWVVTPDGTVHSASSDISRAALVEATTALRRTMDAETRGSAGAEARPVLRQLHRALIRPIAHLLPSDPNSLITIVPHGPLFLISFAALLDEHEHYLVERHTIAYTPSISVLRHTARNRERASSGKNAQLLVVGNPALAEPSPSASGAGRRQPSLGPLPGAEQEARAIADLYSATQVTSLIGAQASEQAVRGLAPHRSIIHLATHAVIDDAVPMNSYLALAANAPPNSVDAVRDGYLTVSEVFGLDLRAALVTLSACSTDVGQVSGEGVIGLSRAFIYAGAASVLVSLWRVADTVATIEMGRFYRKLIDSHGNKAAALAAAQRQMIVSLRAGDILTPTNAALAEQPLFWAAFILVGEAR
jgi:CHAT domain-containing protein/tetratricopeptide (TPR) repeat protein